MRVAASSDRVTRDEMSIALSAEPLSLELTELREAARVRLRVLGELDLATADVLANRLRALRERRGAVVLDLDDLAFIDASGLRVILSAARDARNDGWEFTVTPGSTRVRRLFVLLDLDKHLPLEGRASRLGSP
ncbi:MAG TPA: STAS domain-containing protein [Polyangiaceae bacterium]|nr:STAS domain-containing protein [Polyangiaceae bacterium]